MSLSLGVKLIKCKPFMNSHIQGVCTNNVQEQGSSMVSDGYHSISPAPSLLAVPNIKYEDSSVCQLEGCDSHTLYPGLDRDMLVVIRESLLLLFNSSNLNVPPQLKKSCHNNVVISVSYHLSLEKAALIVTDGRKSATVEISNSGVPELLLDQFDVNGSLKCTLQSQALPSVQTVYLITVPYGTYSTESRKCSNIVSKCSVTVDSINTNVSIPLMMLLRHTHGSIKHKKTMCNTQTSLQLERRDSMLMPVSTCRQELRIEESRPLASSTWLRVQSLVQHLSQIETKGLSCSSPPMDSFVPSVSTTPGVVHLETPKQFECFNSCKSSHSLSSTKSFGSPPVKAIEITVTDQHHNSGAKDYEQPCHYSSVGSLISGEHNESPSEKAVDLDGDTPFGLYLDATGYSFPKDIMDDTTDSVQLLSSDNETTVQCGKAHYNFSEGVRNKRLCAGSPDITSDLQPTTSDLHKFQKDLAISDDQLQLSLFGLVKINKVSVAFQVETIQTVLEVNGITGSVDCRKKYAERQVPVNNTAIASKVVSTKRHTQFIYKLLPTYLSVASRFEQFNISVLDPAISKR